MTVQMTMRVPLTKIHQFQQLVKLHDLRFINFTPKRHTLYGESFEKSFYSIVVETDDMTAYNNFLQDWARTSTNIVEKVRKLPLHRRLLKLIGL